MAEPEPGWQRALDMIKAELAQVLEEARQIELRRKVLAELLLKMEHGQTRGHV